MGGATTAKIGGKKGSVQLLLLIVEIKRDAGVLISQARARVCLVFPGELLWMGVKPASKLHGEHQTCIAGICAPTMACVVSGSTKDREVARDGCAITFAAKPNDYLSTVSGSDGHDPVVGPRDFSGDRVKVNDAPFFEGEVSSEVSICTAPILRRRSLL
jgi:hypothetical protein